MAFIFEILRRAASDLLRPRVLSVLFLPMLVALAVWGGLFWAFGDTWITGLTQLVASTPWPAWMGSTLAAWLVAFGTFFLLGLLLLPAIYVTALMITSLVFMPLLVKVVADSRFPALERREGGGFFGSLGNGLYALIVYLVVWVLTLPFWLLGPFGVAVSILLNAWLNQRLFVYDALAEHADKQELAYLRGQGGWPLYLLAALLGLLHFVPLLNFLAPVYMGLAFTHYGLAKLDELRNRTDP
jgi:CysZ protein